MTKTAKGLARFGGRRKFCIVGYTPHRRFAPVGRDEWVVVGMNDIYHELPPIENERLAWFQLHSWQKNGHKPDSVLNLGEGPPAPRDQQHLLWLQDASRQIPVYVLNPKPELPDAEVLDREAMFAYFGSNYFTNTVTYQIAWALMQLMPKPDDKPPEGAQIGIWGVDMMTAGGSGSEYGWQRPSCEWILGWAQRALGRENVLLPDESDLLKTAYPYGDQDGNAFRAMLQDRRNELSRRRGIVDQQIQQVIAAKAELTGAINTLDHLIHAWTPADGPFDFGRAPLPGSQRGIPGLPGDEEMPHAQRQDNHGVRPDGIDPA